MTSYAAAHILLRSAYKLAALSATFPISVFGVGFSDCAIS